MKYISENIDDFEFHDALAYYKSYEDNNLAITVQRLNIHEDAAENDYDVDMEIAYAEMTLKNIRVLSYTDADAIRLEGKQASEKFMEQIQQGIGVLSFGIENDGIYYFEGSGTELYFIAYCSVENIFIKWDEYKKKAWYELIKRYERDICLSINGGEVIVKADILWNEEVAGEEHVSINIAYENKKYYGWGKDYYWTDAFADLQNNLPENVQIKSCITCRHGNFCPVGNHLDELFCTKDIEIEEIRDLWFYTEDEVEREKRSRKYTCFCDAYSAQTDDYFTYNDFKFYMNELKNKLW